MESKLANTNVVVTAHNINPTVFSQRWLADNNIVQPDELTGSLIITPQLVSVDADRFALLVVPDRLQLTVKTPDVDEQARLVGRVAKIATILPHTPYNALGLNLIWLLSPEREPFDAFLRRLFWRPDDALYKAFDHEDARCGVYLSMNVLGFRLKLDAKPIHIEPVPEKPEYLHLAFNFHMDVSGGEGANSIVEAVGKWPEVHQMASDLLSRIEESDQP